MKKTILALALAAGIASFAESVKADTFGTGGNQFSIQFTSIGNTAQAADPATGYGAVEYNYQLSTYTISQNQLDSAILGGLSNVQVGGSPWSGDRPAANISWYQAAAFVNWLNNTTGHQAAYNLTYSGGAYTQALWQSGQAGYNPSNPFRNSLALYVLPSENEWYKAAFGLSNGSGYTLYAVNSNTRPTAVASGTSAGTLVYNQAGPASVYQAGGLSSYGTMGQTGNIWQWTETAQTGINGGRHIRGDVWFDDGSLSSTTANFNHDFDPSNYRGNDIGIRVASITANAVPEPSTYALFGIGALALVVVYRRKVA